MNKIIYLRQFNNLIFVTIALLGLSGCFKAKLQFKNTDSSFSLSSMSADPSVSGSQCSATIDPCCLL